jgi:hypothetical protein
MPVISKRFLTIVLVIIISSSACKENDDNEPDGQVPINFPGIVFTDEMGNPLGIYGGQDDNDWKYDNSWPAEIQELMNFPDTLDMSETYLDPSFVPGNETIHFIFFPNPVATIGHVILKLPGKVKVKLLLIDRFANPVLEHAYIDKDDSWISLKMDNESLFVEGEVYRMYYSFSVKGNPDFYFGHGDILMCSDRPQNLCEHYLDP